MRIVTYLTDDESEPASKRAVARIRMMMPTKKGKLVEQFHPVIFSGPTVEDVRQTAQQWFDDQLEAERAKAERHKTAAEKRRATREAKQAPTASEPDAEPEAFEADFVM